MTKKIRSIPMKFNYIQFATDIRAASLEHGLSFAQIDSLASVGLGTSSRIVANSESNPKMKTWLAIANALDLDPRDYFELVN